MNFRGAVFDLDGTLLDSMDIWENIDIAFLKKRGLPVPSGYVTEICARSFIEAAEYTIDLFHLSESVDAIIHEWNEMAAYEYAHNVTLSPFAADYLRQLKHAGVKLAVATGLPQTLYEPCLKKNGIYELFDVLCSTDDMARGKEYPDIFVHCADRLGVAPEQCLVFDDVLPAVRSAKQAGMMVYGVFDKYSEHNMEEIKKIADGYLFDFHSAPFPAPRYGQMAELWDLYDITRKKTGATVERGQTIPDGSYHLVVSVWIRNRHGEFLLSQRHPDKPYPLYWECTGGSVLAGESSLEEAVREVREELGLVLEPGHGRLLLQTRRERFQDLYDVWLFHADTPVSCLRLQDTEVIAAQWVSRSMLFTMFRGCQLHPLLNYIEQIF